MWFIPSLSRNPSTASRYFTVCIIPPPTRWFWRPPCMGPNISIFSADPHSIGLQPCNRFFESQ
ncbi:hypothetical protein C8R44DRAFT_826578 [Mycena epipterygia]|nr:hypothetical protein C8R44DRAFT_826578 [Mycena epipterygia]